MEQKLKNILTVFILAGILVSCNQFSTGTEPSKEGGENSPGLEEEITEIDLHTTPERIKTEFGRNSESLYNKQDVEVFYKDRAYAPAWDETGTRISFFESLQKAGEEGLFFTDYHGKRILKLLENSPELNEDEIATLDLLLTDAFLSYSHDLYYGKLNPKELYKAWGISRKERDLKAVLKEGIDKKNVSEALDRLKPSEKIYNDLKIALHEYRELKEKEGSFSKIPAGELIKPGSKDHRIPGISKRLTELGLLAETGTSQDSIYSEEMEKSIRLFQNSKGLKIDGIIGNSTVKELNMSPAERYKQILANLERWRWYPRDLGEHYILVNIPQFKLAVVKDGDTVRTHNVIAGSKARQTPFFTDTLEYIVINPQWHIPPTIKYEDVIPRASTNPSYLRSHNMKVTGPDGKTVDPSSIDWSGPEVKSYNFVQRAGPSNPLGRVKIIYPNRYLIYLHDTPGQSVFNQNQRAESSGCVRVENAVDLSAYILNNQKDWDEERIRKTIASGVTKEVKINRPIQVHHFYWTAWRADNKTVFTEDVYNLDKEIYTRLTGEN